MTEHLMPPKMMGFDWDGTLVDSRELVSHALHATCAKYAKKPLENFRGCFGAKALKDYFPDLFEENYEAAKDYYYYMIEAAHLEKLIIMPHALELLDFLHEKTIPLFIVSNKRHDLLTAELQHLGWTSYFFTWLGEGMAPHNKPHPAPLSQALEEKGVSPSQDIWFVGDTAADVDCALAAKCTAILIKDKTTRNELENSPSKMLDSLLDLKKLLIPIL